MIGIGTVVNSAAIVAGGLVGHFSGKLFHQDQQEAADVRPEGDTQPPGDGA